MGGCTVIRGYVKAGYYTAKVKGIHYCPSQGTDCYAARIVSTEEFAKMTTSSTSGGEK